MAYIAGLKQRDSTGKTTSKRIELKPAVATDESGAITAMQEIATALNTVTGGAVKGQTVSNKVLENAGVGSGNNGIEVTLVFTDGEGQYIPFRIKGMLTSYIGADGVIDTDNADIAALGQAVIDNALLSDGEAVLTLHSASQTG